MTTAACSLCGHVGQVDAHHVTGRATSGDPYFDPALVLPLCRTHHTGTAGVHVVLRILGFDFLSPDRHPLAHRLRRLAVHARVLADAGRPFVLDPTSAVALARLVLAVADLIEQRLEAAS